MATQIPQNTAAFSATDVLLATGGRLLVEGAPAQNARGVSTDTRELLSGKVFVALKGERFDGHLYLERAVAAGAIILVVEAGSDALNDLVLPPHVSLVGVGDTLVALGDLARFHRLAWGGKLVAVAGSAGKTTTRSAISGLLSEVRPGVVHSTVGNLNNRVGVPMILLGLCRHHEFAVVEIGTNCRGEIAELARICCPDVAVLTLIDWEHAEGLGDLDGVEAEESAVYRALPESGIAIGFGEDSRVLRSLQGIACARAITYGLQPGRDSQVVLRELVSDALSRVVVRRAGRLDLSVESRLVGRPGALAVAASVTAVEALTGEALTSAQCRQGLLNVGEPGRSEVLRLSGGRLVIDDTYNSNPVSVENSIATASELRARTGGKLWLVLGEMLELGSFSSAAHVRMGEVAAAASADGAIFIQGAARLAADAAERSLPIVRFFDSAVDVASGLAVLVGPGDVVLVKASRGVRAERVVEGLAAHFGRVAPAEGEKSRGTSP